MSEIIKIDTGKEAIVAPPKPKELLKLVKENDPILAQTMPKFDFDNPPIDPNALASRLVDTCKQYRGLGLSANQCGLPYRVFVMGSEDEYVAFFNPEVTHVTEQTSHMTEGCLSFPFLGLKITRPAEIKVKYQDFTGAQKEATFNGISARCFLHELDHMNGIVYTERVKPLALSMGIKKRNKLLKKMKFA
jgi:peptide deformylase